MPGGGAARTEGSAPPTTQRTGSGPAPGPGQVEDAAGDLAFEAGRVEVAFAGDDEVGVFEAGGQADDPGHEVEARFEAGAEDGQAAAETARGAGARDGGDVDADLGAVAPRRSLRRRALRSATCSGVAPFCGPKIVAASRKGVVTSQATTSSTPPGRGRAGRRVARQRDRGEGAPAPVGRGRAAAADDDAAGAGVAGGQEQLAHAGRVGVDRFVVLGVGDEGAAGGLGHLDDGGEG